MIEQLQSRGLDFEIILVDDACKDKKIIEKASCLKHVIIVHHSKNMGKGAAVKTGVFCSTGDIILFTDADFPYSFDTIAKAIEEVQLGADVVIGDRTISGSDFYSKMPYYRNTGSKIFSFLVQSLAVKGFEDTQCGLKAFSSQAANTLFANIKTKGFAFDVELLKKAKSAKFLVKKIPVQFTKKHASSLTIAKTIKTFIDVICISFQK